MTERANYWQRMRSGRVSRRTLLRASGRAGVGAAGLALVGCGDDDDDAEQQAAPAAAEVVEQQAEVQAQQVVQQQQQQQQDEAVAAAEASPIKRGGTMRFSSPACDL